MFSSDSEQEDSGDEAYEAKACSEQEVSSDEEVAADEVQNGNDAAFDSE